MVVIWLLLRYVLFVPPERLETSTEPTTIESINTIYQESVNQFDTLQDDSAAGADFFPDFSVSEEETTIPPETETEQPTTVENQIEFETETEQPTETETGTDTQTAPTDFFNS